MTEKKAEPCKDVVKCEECAIVIYNTEFPVYAVCNGPCGKSFHASCIDMSKENLRAIASGMMWMCTRCLPKFNDWKNSHQKSSPTVEFDQIHSDIAELKTQISLIVDSLQQTTSIETSSANIVLHHSTPIGSAAASSRGTNECDTERNEIEQNVMPMPTTTNDSCFALLLTNIDSTTSESNIATLVSRCLGASIADCYDVVKLVSKRTDCRLLDFISFKVTLKVRWKDLALRASTWPDGIVFREFEHRPRNVWKP